MEGDVTFTGYGWIPFTRVLDVEQVAAIATDIATIAEPEISAILYPHLREQQATREHVLEFVLQFLGAAKDFTARLAREGRGLVYMIG